MKKTLTVIIAFAAAAILCLTLGFAVRANDLSRFPSGDIYAAQNNSYYGYTSAEQMIVINLEFYEIKKQLDLALVDYQDIILLDEHSKQYVSNAKSINPVYADYALNKTVVRLGYEIDEDGESEFKTGVTTITDVLLKHVSSEKNRTLPIGKIRIEIVDKADVMKNALSYSGYTTRSGRFNLYNVYVTNVSEDVLTLEELCFQIDGAKFELSFLTLGGELLSKDTYMLRKGESVMIKCGLSGDVGRYGVNHTYFRPLIRYTSGDSVYYDSVPATTEYVENMDRNQIAEYTKSMRGNI